MYRLIETPEERSERLAVIDARRKRDKQRERERALRTVYVRADVE